jgi:uncharacterized membrane protein YgcG
MDTNPVVLALAVLAIAVIVLAWRSNTRTKDRPKTGMADTRPVGQPDMSPSARYRADLDDELARRRDLQVRSQAARRVEPTSRDEERRREEQRRREDERRREDDRRRASDDTILMTDPRHPLYHTLYGSNDVDRSCATDRGHKHQAPDCAPLRSDDSYGGSSRSDSYGGSSHSGSSRSDSYGGSDSSSSSSSSDSGSSSGGGGGD